MTSLVPEGGEQGDLESPQRSEQPSVIKSVPQWRLKKIEYGFDERKLNHLTPPGKSAGMVKITFTDNTAIGNTCTRDTLALTIVQLVNAKLDQVNDMKPSDLEANSRPSKSPPNNPIKIGEEDE